MPSRVTWNGPAGTRFENKTDKVLYQFIAALSNTCGVCLQYHLAVGPWWPIQIHRGCHCRQVLIIPGAESPEPFVDYRELLRNMDPSQQTAAVGRSNFILIEKGVVSWDEVVTSGRVRTLREVVSRNKLPVDRLVKAGVDPRIAEKAHAAVNTPQHKILDEQRRQLIKNLQNAGLTNDQIKEGFAAKIAGRVGIASPSTGAVKTIAPGWTDGESLARYLKLDVAKVARAMAAGSAIDAAGAAATHPDPAIARAMDISAREGIAIRVKDREFWEGRYGADWVNKPAAYEARSDEIWINEGALGWSEPGRIKEAHGQGWTSTDSPDHTIRHELGHALHRRNVGLDRYAELHKVGTPAPPGADAVSAYAALNAREFVAEVFAGLKAGKLYPAGIMDEYSRLGGHVP